MSVLFLESGLVSPSVTGWGRGLAGRLDYSIGLTQGGSDGMGNISTSGGSCVIAACHFVEGIVLARLGKKLWRNSGQAKLCWKRGNGLGPLPVGESTTNVLHGKGKSNHLDGRV